MVFNYATKKNSESPILGIHDKVFSTIGIYGKVIAIQSSYTPENDDNKVFVRLDTLPHDPLYLRMLNLLERDERNQEAIERGDFVSVRDIVRVTNQHSSRHNDVGIVQAIGSKGWSIGYTLSDISIAQEIVEREANYAERFRNAVNIEVEDNQKYFGYLKRQVKRTERIPSAEVSKVEYLDEVMRRVNLRLDFEGNLRKLQELERKRLFILSRHDFELLN